MFDDHNQATWDQLGRWLWSRALCGQPVRRVLLTGSRTWNLPLIRPVLLVLPQRATLVHGGAKGADTLADQIWTWLGRRTEVHRPHYAYPGDRGAPLRRDRHMVELGADCCVAAIRSFSRGASQTAAWSIEAGIPTFIFRAD